MISIIVPVFNSKRTISPCLDSLLSQKTEKIFEVIAVNDASTDGTKQELEKFFGKIAYFENNKNMGPAFSRNFGAKKARGEILCFIDSDCVASKNWLFEMAKPFEDKGVAAVQGAYKTTQKSIVARFAQEEIEQRYEKMRNSKQLDWVGSYSAAYNAKIFGEEKGFDEEFPTASGEDPDLSFRIAKKGYKIIFNEKAIVYHKHPPALWKYLKTKFFRAYYRILLYKKHPDKAVNDSYTPQLLKARVASFFLFPCILAFAVFFPDFPQIIALYAFFFLLFNFTTSMPFFFSALGKDPLVALLSPVLLFLRDFFFALGLAAGLVKTVIK
ncbi:MAG: glycosyltransferase [archaeon]|nr:glycosyltransferase [archaeon]